jgi:hypothetical protein
MASGARHVTRRLWLVAGISAPLSWSLAVPRLLIRREGTASLRIAAPQMRFLTGKPLEQLKNGASVGFISQITMTASESASSVLARGLDRFIVSYDIWEEKFSATRPGPPVRSASRLSVPACEAWCLDEMLPVPSTLTADKPFWIKWELRAEDPKEWATIVDQPGINLNRLVELFSRPPRSQQPPWVEIAGPMRLQNLP